MRSILSLPLVARYLEEIDVCIWRMFVFMSVVVIVWGSVGRCDEFFCLYCDAWSCRCSCKGSMSVWSCRCCMCVSCGSSQCCIMHDLQFVNAGRGCKRRPYEIGILQSRSHDCLIGSHEYLLLFTPSFCYECFYHL